MTDEDIESTTWREDLSEVSFRIYKEYGMWVWSEFTDSILSRWFYRNNVEVEACCMGLRDILEDRDIVFEFKKGRMFPLNVFRTQIKAKGEYGWEYTDWCTRACPFCGKKFKLKDESLLCRYASYALCDFEGEIEDRDCSRCMLIPLAHIPKDYLDKIEDDTERREALAMHLFENSDEKAGEKEDVGK